MAKRFLPTQEWSGGEQESIGEYGIVAARQQIVAHTIAKIRHQTIIPSSSFLRRQESLRVYTPARYQPTPQHFPAAYFYLRRVLN